MGAAVCLLDIMSHSLGIWGAGGDLIGWKISITGWLVTWSHETDDMTQGLDGQHHPPDNMGTMKAHG